MAQVTLDSSEYDMLRENKAKAEKEVEELKKTIEGLEKKSRVIVKTEVHPFDTEQAAREFSRIREYRYHGTSFMSDREMFKRCIEAGFGVSLDTLRKGNGSTQYIGFDDIEYKVRHDIQEREEESIEAIKRDYERSREFYDKKSESLEEKYRKRFSDLEGANRLLKDEIQTLEKDKEILDDRLNIVRKERDVAVKTLEITKSIINRAKEASFWELLFNRKALFNG